MTAELLTEVSMKDKKKNVKAKAKARADVIPGRILAALIKGDKIPVYMKYGSCCGMIYYSDGKLRYSVNADLK